MMALQTNDKPQAAAADVEEDFSQSFWRSAAAVPMELGTLDSRDLDADEFRLLADHIPTLCWIANGDGYIVWYNRRWHEYCGTTPAEMEGWGWQSVHDPDVLPAVMERWTSSIATGEPFEMTFPLRGADGRFRPFLTRVQPLRDASGKIVRWFGVNTEVSQQAAAEEQLRRNLETFYNLIKDDPFGVYIVDADFRLAVISAGSRRVFENVRPLIGRDFAEILRVVWEEPFASEAIAHFRRTLATGEPYTSARTVERRGDIDEIEAYDWRIERILLPDGRHGVVCYFYDLSERLHFEEKLHESEERFRRIFEQASDLILTANLDQVITDCNPAAARAVGLTREETIGRKISEFVSPEDFSRTSQMLHHKLEKGGTTRYDVRVRSADGEWLFWEVNSGLTFDDAGKPVGLHVVGRDITERKRFERHQRLLVGELNHRVKNTLAIVQSLAHQTFRKGRPPEDAVARFEGRLQALAAAHNLLTRQNWESASIAEIVAETLAPFSVQGRCVAEGPDVRLPPKTAVSVALAMHELATNASKYGALSNETGRVDVRWSLDDRTFELLWCERDGPPVSPPTRKGFGTQMIKRSLAGEFGGEVELRFDPEGLTCRVLGPVPVIETSA